MHIMGAKRPSSQFFFGVEATGVKTGSETGQKTVIKYFRISSLRSCIPLEVLKVFPFHHVPRFAI